MEQREEPFSLRIPAAEFVVGAVAARQFPQDDRAEIAFVGRSNVGKSSLLNRLLNRRNLARVSRTPGRTREINFFQVGEKWSFVDLPGYGYASVGQVQRSVWDQLLGSYFAQRRNLRAVVLLLDLRRGLTELDQELLRHLDQYGIPALPVATKVDKLKSNERREALRQLALVLPQASHYLLLPAVTVSALNGEGMPGLWQRLQTLLADHLSAGDPLSP
ncbi:MAG: YihA family ribosome biogenesis GTP-binding protein [Magnetococcales bacterium]|nr:YihA family ribosome biogenesis GTP-binding protein [Magnetococcales bacterium]